MVNGGGVRSGGAVAHKQLLPSGDRAGGVLENKYLRATFSSVTNRLELVENLLTGQKVVIDQGLLWFVQHLGLCQVRPYCIRSLCLLQVQREHG